VGYILKKLLSLILVFLYALAGCKTSYSINTKDNNEGKDEAIIKGFRSHQGYSKDELKN
jgi:hypothetical protein